MHTIATTIDGRAAHVHHNSDWSSGAIVNWKDEDGVVHEVVLPGGLFLAVHEQLLGMGVEGGKLILRAALAVMDEDERNELIDPYVGPVGRTVERGPEGEWTTLDTCELCGATLLTGSHGHGVCVPGDAPKWFTRG